MQRRCAEIERVLERVSALAEAIIAANPEIQRE
jgi:hypothetical protein